MFVAVEDFAYPPYELPNIDASEGWIVWADKQEKEMLRKILGGLLYEQFVANQLFPPDWKSTTNYPAGTNVVYGSDIYIANIDNLNKVPGTGVEWTVQPANRWLKLRNGSKYKMDGKTYEWFGFHKAFVSFIHSQWIVEQSDVVTGNGTVESTNENSKVVNPYRRVCKSYNEFADYIGTCEELSNTLYGYLYNSETLFADVVTSEYSDIQDYLFETFVSPGRKNAFNL